MTEPPPDMSGFRMETIREGWPVKTAKPRRAKPVIGPRIQAVWITQILVAALLVGVLVAAVIWGKP